MQEQTARAILRLVGVVSILVGACMTSSALIMFAGMLGMMESVPEIGEVGLTTAISQAMPILFGYGLYRIAPDLARRVVA